MCACSVTQLCLTLRPMDCSQPSSLSMESSRQEYWSGLPFPTPGDLSDLGIKPVSLGAPALAGGFFPIEPAGYRSEKGQEERLSHSHSVSSFNDNHKENCEICKTLFCKLPFFSKNKG